MNANSFFVRAYSLLVRGASYLQAPLLLIIRVYWGWEFFLTGKGKLSDLSKVSSFFADLQIPFPSFSAALVGTTECVGGLLLILGLASRLVSIPLIFLLCVAFATSESEALHSIYSDTDKFFAATPFLFLFACVLVFAFGPGAISIDYLIGRKFRSPASGSTATDA